MCIQKIVLLFSCFVFLKSFGQQPQQAYITGYIVSEANNRPVEAATISVENSNIATASDANGFFKLLLAPGLYNLTISAVGYEGSTQYEIAASLAAPVQLSITLKPQSESLEAITVKSTKDKTRESPVSLRNLGINEIQRNPGGNRDISKVLQALPGAGTNTSSGAFRNDIIIRGGGPAENRFYVDNIEVPVINHFSTQGGSGGPVGLINVDLIKNVNFFTGAFEAAKGNALSSVMDITLKQGRKDKWSGAFTLGTTDVGLRGEGPVSKNTTALFSVRRSYLQLLFKILKLPFLPTYNDMQLKTHTRFNDKVELSVVALGALDQFALNKAANKTEQQQYILGYIPNIEQWNYTIGSTLRLNQNKGNTQFILSRSMIHNRFFKYTNNEDDNPAKKVNDNVSRDIENQIKAEQQLYSGRFKTNIGATGIWARYTVDAYNKIPSNSSIIESIYSNAISFLKYALYAQSSASFFNGRLSASAGFRWDGANLTATTSNPLNQTSPRVSASFDMGKGWSINANSGLYHQLPATTILGYSGNDKILVNQNNQLRYTQSLHGVLGIEKRLASNLKISVESFYKKYHYYPVSIRNGISLANVGADYGIVGNEPVQFNGNGKAYGVEVFVQQKLWKNFYGWMAYTYVRSLFSNADGAFAPSSWDQNHLLNIVAGKRFKRNWEAGIKFRYSGGNPYTPYNVDVSSLQSYWDVAGKGFLDYSRINTLRTAGNYQVDFRIDKKWLFTKWNLNIYFDMQNATMAVTTGAPLLTVQRNADGTPKQVANSNPARYETKTIANQFKTFVETIGIIIEL